MILIAAIVSEESIEGQLLFKLDDSFHYSCETLCGGTLQGQG